MNGYYAIDLTKLGLVASPSLFEIDLKEKIASMPTYAPIVHLLPMKALWACHGPFSTLKEAQMMAANEVDDDGYDYFQSRWAFIELPVEGTAFEKVLMPKKYFVCTDSECDSKQRFKGFCSMCKSKGKEMVPTFELRDWNNVLGGVI